MRSFESIRPAPSATWQIPVAVLSGVALALMLTSGLSAPLIVGGVLAFLFLAIFLQRPELGLLILLLTRASSDIGLVFGQGLLGGGRGTVGALVSPNAALILITIFGGGLFVISRRIPFISLPGGMAFCFLLLMGLLGMIRSHEIAMGLNDWLPLVAALVIYAIAAFVFSSRAKIQRVIDVMAVAFVVPALFGFYQLAVGHGSVPVRDPFPRINGTFVHPNAFGLYLVVVLGLFVPQALAHSRARRWISLLIVAAAAVLLVATYARFAWAGALVVLLTIGYFRSRKLLVLVPVVAVLAFFLIPGINARLADPLGGSYADRIEIWQGLISEWQGLTQDDGLFLVAVNRLVGLGPASAGELTRPYVGRPTAVHDDYLRVLIEDGILGLLFYLILFGVLILSSHRTLRQSADPVMSAVALSFFALTLAYLVMSYTGNVLAYTYNQVYFWTLAGITAAIPRVTRLEDDGRLASRQA